VTAEFISNRTGEITIGVEGQRRDVATFRVTDFTPREQISTSVGQRKLMTPDEILRMPRNEALLIIQGEQVLKVNKFDYSLHPETEYLPPEESPTDYIPQWRIKDVGGGKLVDTFTGEIIREAPITAEPIPFDIKEEAYAKSTDKAVCQPERVVVKASRPTEPGNTVFSVDLQEHELPTKPEAAPRSELPSETNPESASADVKPSNTKREETKRDKTPLALARDGSLYNTHPKPKPRNEKPRPPQTTQESKQAPTPPAKPSSKSNLRKERNAGRIGGNEMEVAPIISTEPGHMGLGVTDFDSGGLDDMLADM